MSQIPPKLLLCHTYFQSSQHPLFFENCRDPQKINKKKTRSRKRVNISTPEATTYGRIYQAADRDYETIPLDSIEMSEDDEDRNGLRRSRRRRFRPVEFWKNERPAYGANTMSGTLAEIYGDMPMVTGIIKAKPTPYKKIVFQRKVDDDEAEGKRNKKKTKNKKTKAMVENEEEEVFDSRKLQKVRFVSFSCFQQIYR